MTSLKAWFFIWVSIYYIYNRQYTRAPLLVFGVVLVFYLLYMAIVIYLFSAEGAVR